VLDSRNELIQIFLVCPPRRFSPLRLPFLPPNIIFILSTSPCVLGFIGVEGCPMREKTVYLSFPTLRYYWLRNYAAN
jgi:hypothetical protein